MRNSELRRRWQKSGTTFRGLAGRIGVDHATIRRAVAGLTKCPSPEVAHAIAGVIGEPAQAIWPTCDIPGKARAGRRAA